MDGVTGLCVGASAVVLASIVVGFLTRDTSPTKLCSLSLDLSVDDRFNPAMSVFRAPLLDAIIDVESGGDPNAVGDGGEAVGILQIRPIMVREVNRIAGMEGDERRYTEQDRFDPEKSKEVFWIYSNYYADYYADWSDQGIARRWNGGPTGHKKEATEWYWKKVEAALAR